MAFERGSEWRKWDLHVHTPDSIVHHYKKTDTQDVWEKYLCDLEALDPNIKVLGINDYLFLDGYKKVVKAKTDGRLKNIELLLPVIELRLTQFTGKDFEKINFHVIFSNELSAEQIEDNFIKALTSKFKLSTDNKSFWNNIISKESLIELGTKIINSVPVDQRVNYGTPLQEGFNNLTTSEENIREVLEHTIFENKYITAIGKTEWANWKWNDGSIAIKKSTINSVDIVFTASLCIENFNNSKKALTEALVNDLLLDCSDAHHNKDSSDKDRLGNCNTWIKADPTFEGLKQIAYEPSRVKIQEGNPDSDTTRSFLTELEIQNPISILTDDELSFAKQTIPLNNSLVTIIGSRGSGKSTLINYLAHGISDTNTPNNYKLSNDFVLKRKKSYIDTEDIHLYDTKHSFPLMYISQSEIKKIVEKPIEFSDTIKRTINVNTQYILEDSLREKINTVCSEYNNSHRFFADPTNNKDEINKKIKEQEEFVTSISTESNKQKLENYQQLLQDKTRLNSILDNLSSFNEQITQEELKLNETIKQINIDPTITPLSPFDFSLQKNELLSNKTIVEALVKQKEQELLTIKQEFPNDKGDISDWLNNLTVYNGKIIQLKAQLDIINSKEIEYNKLLKRKLPRLAKHIRDSLIQYKSSIDTTWDIFFKGDPSESEQNKLIRETILKEEDIKLSSSITLDSTKMYTLLYSILDGRSYVVKDRDLEKNLQITSFEDLIKNIGKFQDTKIFYKNDIPKVITHLLQNFHSFINVLVNISYKGKDIKRLSAGERGTLYLRLQLTSNIYTPLIFDQPEDDLDNEFIMSELVDIFKLIKQYRQVIIVTHNANLVVNADADQIIVAQNNDNVLSYKSGSLENLDINKDICRILEGGEEAFQKRKKRYQLK